MTAGWPAVLLFALVAGTAGLAGVWLMYAHEARARRRTSELITFASGLLVSGSLLHLLPRGTQLAGEGGAMGWALAAFIVLYVAENHFLPHPHARTDPHVHTDPRGRADRHGRAEAGEVRAAASGPTGAGAGAVLGLALHSVLDGIAVGAGFSASFLTGGVIVSLVVAHKLPVGIASMSVLYHGGMDRKRSLRYGAAVAVITPVSVVAAFALLRDAAPELVGAFVAAAAGSFLYVGAADLLPEGQASGHGRNTLVFLLGVAVIVAVLLAVPHAPG